MSQNISAPIQAPEAVQDPINITEAAAVRVWELIQEEGNFNLKLRVFVTGGGCSGMRYDFTFDEDIKPDDALVSRSIPASIESTCPAVQVLVDSLSLQYLNGAEIDYQKESVEENGAIVEEKFIIRNPHAKTTCGCGSSFTAEDLE